MSEIGRIQQMLKFKSKLFNINYYQLNYYIMKKILFVALGATLLAAGCQKTEIINQVNPDGKMSMTFSTGISKLTKSATATGTENLEEQGFVLSAIAAYEDPYTTGVNGTEFNHYYDELNNLKFDHKSGAWEIEEGESYFWPGKDRDLVFFAVSSAQKTTVDNKEVQKYANPEIAPNGFGISGTPDTQKEGIYNNVTVSSYVISGYTVVKPNYVTEEADGKKIGDQTGADDDLMVADVVLMNQDDVATDGKTKGQVDLQFNHTLSKVEFVFSTNETTEEDYPVTITSVVVKDVVKTADLTISVDFKEGTISDNVYDWDAKAATDYVSSEEGLAVTEDYTIDYPLALTSSEQRYATWLVIPQTLKDKMVSITYTIGDKANAGADPKEFTTVWPLAATGVVDAWEINNYVKYKVNLSPNIITFNPVVEKDWNPVVAVDPSTGQEVDDTPVTPDLDNGENGENGEEPVDPNA